MLTTRIQTPELMDNPDLPAKPHRAALRGLQRINWVSRTVDRLWRAIENYADPQRGLRVLDVGSGGGDVLCGLVQKAMQCGVPFQAVGCDISSTACEHATRYADTMLSKSSRHGIQFIELDCLKTELPANFDVAFCSLFLHHLDETSAIELLKRLKHASNQAVLVDDLIRCMSGYALAWCGTRLLSGSRIVHVDGPLSVKSAFTMTEMMAMSEVAGLDGAEISTHWPFRFLMHWWRK